ncbi:MAG: hypothetical protein ABFR82_02520 [Nitrospirota bacterium]
MTDQQLKKYCDAEFENIDTVVSDLLSVVKEEADDYSTPELAAIATFLHNIYKGIENLLKRILIAQGSVISKTPTWHRDLLKTALEKKIVDRELYNLLSEYLAFRHFFVHAYSFNLKWGAIKPLVNNLANMLKVFRSSIERYL